MTDSAAAPAAPPMGPDMLAEHVYRLFQELEVANARRREAIISADAWRVERERLLAAYRAMLGPFPERTALEARVTGAVQRERYTIEKLIFHARPGVPVTANLYLPRRLAGQAPGVLVPCGHSENGKAAETYQRVCAGLAGKGYVVLIYDPVGQGERQLYWDATRRRSRLGGNTTQHSYAGNQSFLLGTSLTGVMVWESLRAIDYLCSRPEVDGQRIGMAGNSGGGTNTAQTAPLDERIKAAAVCCYVTTMAWRRRSWTTGDAEQNLVGQLPAGLDHADLLRLVAPRPVMVGSAALDYFPLAGARQSVEIARGLYATLGVEERITHVVTDAPHGYSVGLRRGTYRWLNRWLGDPDSGDEEPDTPVESDDTLRCTADGQVTPPEAASVFALNRALLEAPRPPRARPVQDAIKVLTRYESPAERPVGRPAETRLFRHEGLRRVETVTVWPEPDVALDGTLLTWRETPPPGGRRALLWLGSDGAAAALSGDLLRPLLASLPSQGWAVLAADVRGVGATAPRSTGRATQWLMGAEAFLAYECLVAGRPLFGMRLRDVLCLVDYVLTRPDVDGARGVVVAGTGWAGLLALHAAAIDARIGAVATVDTLATLRSLVEHEDYTHSLAGLPPGVVANPASPDGYDVDELLAAIAPRPVLRLRHVDHLAQPLSAETDREIGEQVLSWIREG